MRGGYAASDRGFDRGRVIARRVVAGEMQVSERRPGRRSFHTDSAFERRTLLGDHAMPRERREPADQTVDIVANAFSDLLESEPLVIALGADHARNDAG